MRNPKANYKIWIISKDKYFSNGYNPKTTWSSLHWTLEAAKNANKYYQVSDIEIHEFPMTSAIKHSLKDCLEEKSSKDREKFEIKKAKEGAQKLKKYNREYQDAWLKMKTLKEKIEKLT